MAEPSEPTEVTPPPPPGAAAPPPPAASAPPPPAPSTPPPPGGSSTPPPPGAAGDGGSGGSSKAPWLIVGGVLAALAIIAGIVVVASGGDDDGSVGSVDDVKTATVQILTEGSFEDPVEGAVSAAGSGTGFIIDESGIAVTNNHVVTGAAKVQVLVGGEDEELDAEILGVSECSDLAVIDIEGDGFPTLEFADADPSTGTEVFVAGFPLGDPEYTLTKGIISKAEAATDTEWAAVEGVLETDAKINPGNSGGPLVNEEARVVGVNYAANPETDQNLAIKASLAQGIVDTLREGTDVESLGMNTQAVVSEDGSASGVWVAAVSAGSPAAETGVEAGDLITEMNGLAVGDDGTMGDYCDILSSAGDAGAIDVVLVRTTTGEVLEGEFNGAPLEVVGSVEGDTPGGDGGADSGGPVTVTSDNGSISAQIPAEWEFATDTDGFTVAPDVDAFNSSFTASGLVALLIPGEQDVGATVDELLASISPGEACDEVGRSDLDVAPYTAGIEVAFDCGAAEADLIVLTGGTGNTLAVFAQATPAELDVVLQVLDTLQAQ